MPPCPPLLCHAPCAALWLTHHPFPHLLLLTFLRKPPIWVARTCVVTVATCAYCAPSVRGEDENTPPKLGDYIGHALTVPWKVLFAICPPTMMCDGYFAFFVALLLIGVVTALIGDLASLLGCVVGIPGAGAGCRRSPARSLFARAMRVAEQNRERTGLHGNTAYGNASIDWLALCFLGCPYRYPHPLHPSINTFQRKH